MRSEWSVASLSKCFSFRANHFPLNVPSATYKNNKDSYAFLCKRSCLFQHFTSLFNVNGVLLHFLNAVVSEKITFFCKCLKLLTSIHKKFTCVSMKEKQSVPTLKFTVRSEWSVASLSKCCSFRENDFLFKVPKATLKHSQASHLHFSEREAVCCNTSIHCAK